MEASRTGQAQMTIPASKAVNYAVRVYRLEGYMVQRLHDKAAVNGRPVYRCSTCLLFIYN